jgi:hypothetical protein
MCKHTAPQQKILWRTMMSNISEFFDEPVIVEPQTRTIIYRLGVNTGTTQYVKISRSDELFLRELCKVFLEHIKINKDNNAVQKQMYMETFIQSQNDLPKPDFKRTGIRHNTYASFINGMEENFGDSTRNYTLKQWPHVIDIANIAVNYFNVIHPKFFGKTLPSVEMEER